MPATKLTRYNFTAYNAPKGVLKTPRHYMWLRRNRARIRQVKFKKQPPMLLATEWVSVARSVLPIRSSELHISDHTLTLINRPRKTVARISFSRQGNQKIKASINSHHDTSKLTRPGLKKNSQLNRRFLWQTEDYIAGDRLDANSTEALKQAASVYATQSKTQRVSFKRIETQLSDWQRVLQPAYARRFASFAKSVRKAYGKQTKLVLAPIHGDLTYRNCLRRDGSFVYIDWDRSGEFPPELDVLLYLVDHRLHQTKQHDEITYQDYLDAFADTKAIRKYLKQFYKDYPKFAPNQKHFKQIYCILLYRFTLLSVINIAHPNNFTNGLTLIDDAESKL